MAELRSAIFWVLCPKQSLHCYSMMADHVEYEVYCLLLIDYGIMRSEFSLFGLINNLK
ncbi:MAG: hypothetical protein IM597_03235 [Pseudanabaena sp. M176S2SP2A07QC]|nr:hypothetical protein [Pseudanabaena sp. M176S2SP2A07QC]MCA6541390.1 hypothetical protein [Pseudanabaena sp. M037S2SP2A07QC]MCA6564985.1 hypothetical protein [Pseudanabaena sp. M151S2SP2A07QC]